MKRTIGCMLLLGFAIGLNPVVAQQRPVRVSPASDDAARQLPVPDVAALLSEDAARDLRGEGPRRVGWPVHVGWTPANSGTWNARGDGGRSWRLELQAAGALWLVAGFDRFHLRSGETLRLVDATGGRVFGPYTRDDVQAHGELWVPPIDGDRVVVELTQSAELDGAEPDLRLGTVSYGYRPWRGSASQSEEAAAGVLGGGSGPCNIDVACPEAEPWDDQKRGVVKLLIGGVGLCSGSLINNTAFDCKPYILTGDHCYDLGGTPASTTFIFNFERTVCGGGQASEDQFVSGSLERARFDASDFRLLELPPLPLSLTGLYFNGWNRSIGVPSSSTTIHHPGGDPKKISFDEDPAVNGTTFGANFWKVEWEAGTTEGGSSGAPLFDQNRRIVGQLRGGFPGCGAPDGFENTSEFGKLSASWPNGLSEWLDPLGSGAEALVGLDQAFCGALAPRLSYAGHAVNDAQGNFDGIADPGDIVRLEVTLENDGPLSASAIIATLTSTSPDVTVIDDEAIWNVMPPESEVLSEPPHFLVDLGADIECGAKVPFSLSIVSAQGTFQSSFDVPTGVSTGAGEPVFADDMESGTNGWVAGTLLGSNAWSQTEARSNSPTHSWFVDDIIGASDSTLRPPAISGVPTGGVLRFAHFLDTDPTGDGGVLEITVDGANWNDLGERIVVGGYNSVISEGFGSPLSGRAAWSGDLGGWQQVEVDLSDFAGQVVLVRWRFATDSLGAGDGWYLDDVSVDAPSFACAPPQFRIFPGALCRGLRMAVPGGYSCGQAPSLPPLTPSRQRR